MDIILVQPKTGKWDYLGSRLPESLLAVATLPAHEGYKIKLIDQRINENWKKDLLKALKEEPLCVGVTALTGSQIHFALEISKLVKENSDTSVILGGVHSTLQPKQTVENKNIDIAVAGEGEITFLELVHALEKGSDLNDVRGIVYKKDGKLIETPPRPFIQNLDELPDVPYELVDMSRYYALDLRGRPSATLMTSRGCPYRCTFCSNPAIHKRHWRGFSAERTIEKIKYLVDKFNIRDLYFQDDNFCGNIKRFKEIISRMANEFDDLAWGTLGVRADAIQRLDDDALKLMERSGCMNLDIGIESGSQRILELMKKDETPQQFIDANKRLSKYNFILKYTFVAGFPTETLDELKQSKDLSIKLLRDNPKAYALFFIFAPYMGTEAWNLAIQNGFQPPKTLEEWSNFNWDTWFLEHPSWLSKERIKLLQNVSFTSYFSNRNIKNKINKWWGKILFDLYEPIAKFRFEKDFYFFPIERKFEKLLFK